MGTSENTTGKFDFAKCTRAAPSPIGLGARSWNINDELSAQCVICRTNGDALRAPVTNGFKCRVRESRALSVVALSRDRIYVPR